MRMSFVAFSKENVGEGSDVGYGLDADFGTRGGVRIITGRLITGSVARKATFCGSLNEKSSDKVVEGKRWSTSLVVTVNRKVKIKCHPCDSLDLVPS